MLLRHVAMAESGKTTTAVDVTTTVNQQTSATDGDWSTVVADVTTITGLQTQTGKSFTFIRMYWQLTKKE